MVGTNLKIDERSKLEKLKDMMSEIADFDTVKDTLLLSDNADSMPAENIIKLYMKKAIAIDKRHRKKIPVESKFRQEVEYKSKRKRC